MTVQVGRHGSGRTASATRALVANRAVLVVCAVAGSRRKGAMVRGSRTPSEEVVVRSSIGEREEESGPSVDVTDPERIREGVV